MFKRSGAGGSGRWIPEWRSGLPKKRRCAKRTGFFQALRRHKIFAAATLLFALLIISSALPHRGAQTSGEAPSGSRIDGKGISPSLIIYEMFLGREIPGLQVLPKGLSSWIDRPLGTALYIFTGIDPADSCSLLDLELGAGRGVSLQALAPVKEEGETISTGKKTKEPASQPWGEALFPLPSSGKKGPGILLYHTHASETFIPGSASPEKEPTVVTVGAELARILEKDYGLTVLHHQDVYDLPRRDAYKKARPAMEKIISENPGLELVIDLHRDGIPRSKTTATMEGRELAKILLVHGSRNPQSEINLELTLCLQRELEAVMPSLSRGIIYQDFIYNQDLHPYAALIEVGSHENSIDEALRTLPYLAEAIARTYYIFFLQD